MGKRILITSTDLMMVQFLIPHVENLAENGFEVEIACSDVGGRMEEIRERLDGVVGAIYVVRLVRSPASFTNFKGYKDMKRIIEGGRYDIIWTNEPVMGVVTRLAARRARRNGTKVLYMVHGFHFYRGAPLLNWMVYYPIEKFCSQFCDEIVTINQEDYQMAREKMKAQSVRYIHGIGVDTSRLNKVDCQNDIRRELSLPEDSFLVLSIGELSQRKNQKTIIKSIAQLNDPGIHYIVCGKGGLLDELQTLAADLEISEHVHFLGYRMDVVDICSQSDIFAMSSYQEGLPVAALEAMCCGLPLVASNIRGLVDVMENGVTGYLCDPDDVDGFSEGITRLYSDCELRERMSQNNIEAVKKYDIRYIKAVVYQLMEELVECQPNFQ